MSKTPTAPGSWEECLGLTQNRDDVLKILLSTAFFSDSDFCGGQACRYSGPDGVDFGGCFGRLENSKSPCILYNVRAFCSNECGTLKEEIDLRRRDVHRFVDDNRKRDKQTILFACGREAAVLFAAMTKGPTVDVVLLESIHRTLEKREPSSLSWRGLKSFFEGGRSDVDPKIERIATKDLAAKFPKDVSVGLICSRKDGEEGAIDTYGVSNALADWGHAKTHVLELDDSPRGEYAVHNAKDQLAYHEFVVEMYSKYVRMPLQVRMTKK